MNYIQKEGYNKIKGVCKYCISNFWGWGRTRNAYFAYDSFSDKVGHEVTQCETNQNPFYLGTSLPYS